MREREKESGLVAGLECLIWTNNELEHMQLPGYCIEQSRIAVFDGYGLILNSRIAVFLYYCPSFLFMGPPGFYDLIRQT